MKSELESIKQSLSHISRQIDETEIGLLRARHDWGGADVVITSHAKEVVSSDRFYPESRTVVTTFSKELSWLFERLRDAFSEMIDGTSKIEFYGRLANAASNYQQHVNGGENAKDILRAVLYEAVVMLEEIDEGTFEYLSVASGDTILADLVSDAEKTGYIGVDATKRFFKKMEEKHL
ncbi:MAG: hypothetical protein ABIU09_02240 [Pyrinomonadaceae bacterium]